MTKNPHGGKKVSVDLKPVKEKRRAFPPVEGRGNVVKGRR
jgi:hypothetical protein